jgi:hypothetical protein
MPTKVKPIPTECPKCGERLWDNRIGKKNPKAPDFKCRDKTCDGVIWPPSQKDQFVWADAAPVTANNESEEKAELQRAISAPTNGALALEAVVDQYNKVLDLVLQTTVPKLVKADIGASPESINATVATILIQHQRSNGR